MRRKMQYSILAIIITIALYYAEQYVNKENEHYPESSTTTSSSISNEFEYNMLPSSTTNVIIRHNHYTLSYVEKYEQAEWVAYELRENHIQRNDFKRPYFVEDRKVKSKSADWRNYKNSGYDKGHLLPAGDRGFDYNAYHETFLTSNISPQVHEFNAGIWNALEQKVRYWAKRYDDVYVITGGVLKKGLPTIGDEGVAVPEEYYKIIVDKRNGVYKAIAFLLPNKKTSSGSFYKYATSIDIIEQKTGIDFFPDFPDAIENDLEKQQNLKDWPK